MNDSTTATDDAQVVDPQSQGITDSQATDSPNVEGSESTAQAAVSEETLDAAALAKENAQIKMELNQKRNALAEIEKQKEEARQAEMTEVERLREELAQRDAEKADQELIALRDKFISEYPDEKAKETARKLISENPSNLLWGDVTTEDEAKAAIHRQMDAFKGPEAPAEDTEEGHIVHPNNPSARIGDREIENLTAAQMREVLPIADAR